MKTTLSKEVLLNGLNKVNKAIDVRTPLASLTGIRMELNQNGLELLASDSDLSIKTVISNEDLQDVKEEDFGSLLVDAKFLVDAVRNVKSEKVTLEEKESHVLLKAGRSKFKLVKMDVVSYPRIDFTFENESKLTVNSQEFKSLIEHTVYATSNKETRPILTGLNFKSKNGYLVATGCDSYRFGKKQISFMFEEDKTFDFTLPKKTVIETSKLLGNKEKEIELLVAQRGLIIKTDDLLIRTRLIDGSYPDIDRLTPDLEDFLFTIKVNKKELLNKLGSNQIVISNVGNPTTVLRLYEDEENDELARFELSSKSEIGESIEILEVLAFNSRIPTTKRNKNGDLEKIPLDYSIAFNNFFLQETLKKIEQEDVTIYFNASLEPFVVKTEDDDELHLLLPYRVR